MIPLYRKELRALAPFALLGMLLVSGDLLVRPLTERHDEASWVHIASYVDPASESSGDWIWMVLAASIAFAAYPREHDEGTIALLHSLPIRPSSIYLAKVAAGWTALLAIVVTLVISDGLQSNLSPASLEGGQWRLGLALEIAALQLALCLIVYGHALLASVARLFGLIPYVVLLVMTNILEESFAPLIWADPTELVAPRYHGRALVIPWGPLALQGALALFAYALAYLSWVGPAARVGRAIARLRASLAGKLAAGCAGVFALGLLTLIALGVLIGGMPDDDESDDGEGSAIAASEVTTERYRLSFPSDLRGRAAPLIADADRLHEAVRARLGADVGPVLVADLTDTSAEHLGLTSWTTLRVGLAGERDPEQLRRTFTHETAHAFQHRLTDGRGASKATRFFLEGSAEHLAQAVVPNPEELARVRAVAAASWTRHRMRFEDLADDERLRARFDPLLVYPLGELFTAALVETYGEQAIGDVLRAMGRAGAPRDLSPRAYWEDTLRAAGYDLETVLAAFERAVRREADQQSEAIEALPRLGGGVRAREGAYLVLEATLDRDAPAEASFFVRVRAGPTAGDTETFGVEGEVDPADRRRVTFRVLAPLLPGPRFQILFSVAPGPRGWAFSESWQWASSR